MTIRSHGPVQTLLFTLINDRYQVSKETRRVLSINADWRYAAWFQRAPENQYSGRCNTDKVEHWFYGIFTRFPKAVLQAIILKLTTLFSIKISPIKSYTPAYQIGSRSSHAIESVNNTRSIPFNNAVYQSYSSYLL